MRPISVGIVGAGLPVDDPGKAIPAEAAFHGDLYFAALDHSTALHDDTFILSSAYGLLYQRQLINVPEQNLFAAMSLRDRLGWTQRVANDLRSTYLITPIDIVFYAGTQYTRYIPMYLEREAPYWVWTEPLRGLGLKDALGWFYAQQVADEPEPLHQEPSRPSRTGPPMDP